MFQKNLKSYLYSLSLVATILLLSGCSEDSNLNIKVFKYNQVNHITSLDPAFAKSQNNIWATHHLFNGLVQLDSNLNIIPDIAHSWDINADGTKYTFHLRDNVYFHNSPCFDNETRKVLASDFVYSLNRLLDKKVNSPGSWLFSDKVAKNSAFTAPNDSTFVIRLNKAFRPMLGIMTMQYCSVIPHEAIDYFKKDFRSNPVGTGPFKFKKWLENQAMFFSKNEKYFESSIDNPIPSYDGIKILFINDRKIALLEMKNKKLDFFAGLESSFINDLLTPEGDLQPKYEGLLNFIKNPFLNMEYLGINQEALEDDSPLKIKEVRQAMNYALNKELMLKRLRNNVGVAAQSGFIPRGLPSHNPNKVIGYKYDMKKARLLLAKAGHPNGEGLKKIILTTNKDYLDLCIFASKEWEKIGLEVEIDMLESAVLRDGMRKSKIPFFRASWIADYPDGESFLCMFYGKNPPPPNYTRYKNTKFDKLYENAIVDNIDSSRYQKYWQMDQMIVDDAPVIFLFYDESASVYSERIKNISGNAVNLLNPREYSIEEYNKND